MSAAKAKRLRPGELDGLVLSYLATHKDDGPLTATAIGKGIERSAGTVANCLARLAKDKTARAAGWHRRSRRPRGRSPLCRIRRLVARREDRRVLGAKPIIGRLFGYLNSRGRAKAPGPSPDSRSLPGRIWFIVSWPIRLVFQLFFRPSPLEAQIPDLTGVEPPVYVRIVRQSQENAIGLLDAASLTASRSARGRGLALAARWIPGRAAGSTYWMSRQRG